MEDGLQQVMHGIVAQLCDPLDQAADPRFTARNMRSGNHPGAFGVQ
jgi:hypothetical protein